MLADIVDNFKYRLISALINMAKKRPYRLISVHIGHIGHIGAYRFIWVYQYIGQKNVHIGVRSTSVNDNCV